MSGQGLALILASAAKAEEPPQLPAVVVDPVRGWAAGLRSREIVRLCFEGGPPIPDTPPINIRFSNPLDVAASVADINASAYHVRYRTLTLGQRVVVVPTETIDEQGRWNAYPSVLDTVIDLGPSAPATADVMLDRWMAAVSAATGRPVSLGTLLNPYGMCDVSGRGVARDLLAAILDCRGPDDVWSFSLSREGAYDLYIYHMFRMSDVPIYRPELTYEEWNRPPREIEGR
jgi:hypothetical protein